MPKTFFLTGTDTDIGKTHIMGLLLQQFQAQGITVCGLKPIASGCELIDGELTNSDARLIQQACDFPLGYSQLNPFAFEPAIAPHIAAKLAGLELDIEALNQAVNVPQSELCLIEGAGGWLTPLNDTETYADWVEANQFAVIVVIGMKLGCLNHAQLTIRDIEARGLKIAGWIANQCQPSMDFLEENLEWLQQNIKAPYLGLVPFSQQSIAKLAKKNLVAIELLL